LKSGSGCYRTPKEKRCQNSATNSGGKGGGRGQTLRFPVSPTASDAHGCCSILPYLHYTWHRPRPSAVHRIRNPILRPYIFNRGVIRLATWEVKRNDGGRDKMPEKKIGNSVPVPVSCDTRLFRDELP